MHITMKDDNVTTITQLQELIKIGNSIEFASVSIEERYVWITKVLSIFHYHRTKTSKKNRSIILSYITTMTGLSRSQVKWLVRRKKKIGTLARITGTRNKFKRTYTTQDIDRLLYVDNAHSRLSGCATKKILEREYSVYNKIEYDVLRNISVSHIYNLRSTRQYTSNSLTFTKTNPTPRNIGERRKPVPNGKPGFLRVDSVHQGDQDKEKGVYYVNIVDEVTQWEIVGAVEGISEFFLAPLLEELLAQFPFTVLNFHSDNGSEYINHIVAGILEKLHATQTKSRSRHSNDNGLVEGKNNAIIRKHMGRNHIPRKYAEMINSFLSTHINIYINFHRPCGFATDTTNSKGKIVKKYDTYMTPFEKLKSISSVEQYLKEGVTIATLETIALQASDTEFAVTMQKAKKQLFEKIRKC